MNLKEEIRLRTIASVFFGGMVGAFVVGWALSLIAEKFAVAPITLDAAVFVFAAASVAFVRFLRHDTSAFVAAWLALAMAMASELVLPSEWRAALSWIAVSAVPLAWMTTRLVNDSVQHTFAKLFSRRD